MLQPIVISPPFGNHLDVKWATSIAGSFTVNPRPGVLAQAIKTIRPVKGGWVNRMGLRNPGIENILFDSSKIYSLAALNKEDYDIFYQVVPENIMVEVNLGCPNIHSRPVLVNLRRFVEKHPITIVKLPPPCVDHSFKWARKCYKMGVRYFHLCNTIPTDRGGESGERLRAESLKAIGWMKNFVDHGDIRIIGGGGIYSPEHVDLYKEAGVDIFSLSTVCFQPWKLPGIINRIKKLI